ncbi:hypothetical protein DCAR_0626086 [Daucus carota subsp. sativus]|uniref:Replication protein A 70 kDa DNA-binding subunit B/D first OB fold domain-containing protein n=1 Tax=Daucus carota subsp. sativus TaxID=79200 RepID=A0A161WUN8_DAUCS|nr:hypothetical protein DCAR_0626086 [Daucus carota subsp. sativus]
MELEKFDSIEALTTTRFDWKCRLRLQYVVGEIRNVRANIKSTKTDSEKVLTKFDLCDERHTLAVTLFDDFGTQFEQTLRCCKDQQVFVIICAAKIGLYEGLPNLTNYSATRIYINPGHYSVRQLRERIAAMPRAKAGSPPVEEMNFPMLTVKQIQSLPPESSECKVNCKVRVTKVEENANWYYAICTKCPAEIVKENGVFNCINCKRIIPYPDKRFRVCTLCSDSTGTIAIIFLDEDVSRILEKTVFDVEVEMFEAKTEGQFPQQLKELQNEVYDITLNITADNLKKGSKVYEAFQILDKVESGGNFDPSGGKHSEMADAISVDLGDDNMNTPNTGISSTKTRPRVHIEPLPFDPKGASPAKAIKKENPEKTGFHATNLKIKVRVIRLWRGTTKKGEEFTSFNILLLDCKNSTIHAFIPAVCAYDLERQIMVGTVNIISDFIVQAYKDTDGFRSVRAANQLIFTKETKIQQVDEHGEAQEQAKFAITDGSSLWKVTFWDKFARLFVKAIWEKMETPVIIIIAGCRVQNFNNEVILTNVAGTKFYLNYDHHSVKHLRRMLKDPDFAKKVAANNISTKAELLTVQQIQSLDKEFIQQGPSNHFPHCFSLLAQKPYTIKLEINEININSKCTLYWATNICHGFKLECTEDKVEQTVTTNDTEATTSTVDLQGLSGLNCNSSAITKD